MGQALIHFIQNHGLLAVAVLMAAESCGIPFPSEVIMPFAGALAALGHLNLAAAIVVGAFGNLVGSLVAYELAARFGRPLLLGPGRWIGIRGSHLALADRWFARYGLGTVFVGRFIPVIRTYISFPAGLARVPLALFSVLTFFGALVWSAALAIAGYEVGANYGRIAGPIEKAAIVVAILVVLAVIAWFIRGRVHETADFTS